MKCHGGEANQAVLNIIVNAAHAIGDTFRRIGTTGAHHDPDPARRGYRRHSISRQRRRHPSADPRPDVRPILYHQGGGQGNRPGPGDRPPGGRRETRRPPHVRDRRWATGQPSTSACRSTQGAAPESKHDPGRRICHLHREVLRFRQRVRSPCRSGAGEQARRFR